MAAGTSPNVAAIQPPSYLPSPEDPTAQSDGDPSSAADLPDSQTMRAIVRFSRLLY
jgi:hypothetical protein